MNKKGFTLVEMLVSFMLVSLVAAIMLNILFSIKDKSEYTHSITELSVIQSNLIKTVKNDLAGYRLLSLVGCGLNCYEFEYVTLGKKQLQVTDTTISYGDYIKDLPSGVSLKSNLIGTNKYVSAIPSGDNSFLKITIPLVFENQTQNYDIDITHQFEYSTINNIVLNDNSGANAPVLLSGMIPIKWNGSAWIKSNENWYNYDNKEWANVALINSANRAAYTAAANGTVIADANVLAYFVWVPRYKYKLFNVGTGTISSKTIEVVFESSTAVKSTGSANDAWLTHPAFSFGSNELKGIWVGKFETTGTGASPTVKYGVASLRNQTLAAHYVTAQAFNNVTNYGLPANADTHLMKNTEWGAVAYLSKSIYGKTTEIIKNNSSTFLTGCAGVDNSSSFAGCQNTYSSAVGQLASTTGNVYGIYDLAGGAYNAVMNSVYTDGTNTNLLVSSSGFVQATISAAAFNKYIDKYAYDTSSATYARRILGDALAESRTWYSDVVSMATSPTNAFFMRGGAYIDTTAAGIFTASVHNGASANSVAFTAVIPGI